MSLFPRNLKSLGIALLIVGVCVLEASAWAKKVKVEWKPIDGASKYEIHIRSDTKLVVKKSIEDPIWKGELQPGAYSYQIRGYDRADRPGAWTAWQFLAVMPPPPKPRFPEDGSDVELYNPNASTTFKWDPLPGFDRYAVTLKKDGKEVSKTMVNGTSLSIKSLPPGKYKWDIRAVMKPHGRAPASPQELKDERKWISPNGEEGSFRIEQKQLEAPTLVRPLGGIAPSEDRKVKLKWKKVDGAQAYQVHIIRTQKKGTVRSLANELENAKIFSTTDNTLETKISSEGDYVWGVKAVANVDEKTNLPESVGPESVGRFNIDRNAEYTGDIGYVAVSTMLAPYTYRIISPSSGFQGSSQASSIAFRVSGEYYFKPLWAIALGVDMASFSLMGKSFMRPNVELLLKYRTKLSSGQNGWSLSPKIGAEFRDYNQVIPQNVVNFSGSILVNDIYTLGVAAGADLRKQFTQSFSLGMKFSYFYPLQLMSGAGSGSSITGSASQRNMSFGIQGLFWLNPNWALGAGGYFEFRSIGFLKSGSSSAPEQIFMDGTYFFGSVVYRISR